MVRPRPYWFIHTKVYKLKMYLIKNTHLLTFLSVLLIVYDNWSNSLTYPLESDLISSGVEQSKNLDISNKSLSGTEASILLDKVCL